ncbi:hypothetical protein ANI_1_1472124 [Paecilomyces variotii No. 5]|uniref:Uncharacterized protein n=1 Tax=Byssochlamys spectabilis (strain No. 5 / NBRC 109023) TaxID=1356009 RepID=V5FX52_BYSSN|nr:hypothetical protein ANI_1_1472124 [Paecilomyces variotii No. 5]
MNPHRISPMAPGQFLPHGHNPPPVVYRNPPPPQPMGYQPTPVLSPGYSSAQEGLRTQMAKLNIMNNISSTNITSTKTEKPDEQGQSSKTSTPQGSDPNTPFYEGWTLYRADPQSEEQKPSWRQATRSKMNLAQTDLSDMVQKRKKKIPFAEQYQDLGKFKRAHVDLLIKDRETKDDARFSWTCVYVDVVNRPAKGKGTRRGDYETISMDVIIVRRLRPGTPVRSVERSPSRPAFGEVIYLQSPLPSPLPIEDKVPTHHGMESTTQAVFGNGQQRAHSFANAAPSTGPHFHHPSNPAYSMGSQTPVSSLGVPAPMPPTLQPANHPAAVHMNMGMAGARPHPEFGTHNGAQTPHLGMQPPHPGAQSPHTQPPHAGTPSFREPQGNNNPSPQGYFDFVPPQNPAAHPRTPASPSPFPDVIKREPRGRPCVSGPKILHAAPKSSRSRAPRVELDWPPEDSSVGDDESILFEIDYDSSATEESSDGFEKISMPRSSRHGQHSPRHERYQMVYRSHSERSHSSKGSSKTAHRDDQRRKGRAEDIVEIIPENSLRARRKSRSRSRASAGAVALARPRVTYSDREELRDSVLATTPLSSLKAELAYLEMLRDQERRLRDMEHVTSRRLAEREDLLRLREEDLDYREREVDDRDRFSSSHLTPRHLSPRGHPQYHHHPRPGYQRQHSYLY